MVGDSRTDIDTAKAAGIPVVAVDFGYTDRHVREFGPSRIISHFDELTVDVCEDPDAGRASLTRPQALVTPVLDLRGRPPYIAARFGPWAAGGRLAQRESTPFTRVGSQVQSLHRPP